MSTTSIPSPSTRGPVGPVGPGSQLVAGLDGVVVAATAVGDVRGEEGFYHYGPYAATELARRRSLEDVWHLLVVGHLPTASEADRFGTDLRGLRALPGGLVDVLADVAQASGEVPLSALRTAVSLTAASLSMRPTIDLSRDDVRRDVLRLSALMPTLVAALHRLGQGQRPIPPADDLGHAANYLYMLTGRQPDPADVRAVEQYLITTIDHGFNSSTFAARVVTSTGADVGAAFTAAIGALSGPLHGGAPSRALDMLEEIGAPDRAEAWVRERVGTGQRIMGFGHRVYRTRDPRSQLLKQIALDLGGPRVDLAVAVEEVIVETLAQLKPGRDLYANVEYYAAVVLERCGIPPELFTATFATSRAIGWGAHILEQADERRIIRPSARYVGPPAPQPVPSA